MEETNFGKPLVDFVKKRISGHPRENDVYLLVAEHITDREGVTFDPKIRRKMHEAVAMALSQKVPTFMRVGKKFDSPETQQMLKEKFEESMHAIADEKLPLTSLFPRSKTYRKKK